ncbi:hypothetical protein L3X38_031888 [Prunus dulcis]|uniref:Uncharacterized protein n=1 Tax=Prunus dulcis TaxID=3755 RepID=A0AAD4VF68_PRUDU|nr:hypothetical protein L3X38_031888 [Prunus dulcis]
MILSQTFFSMCITSRACLTGRYFQYSRSKNIDFFFQQTLSPFSTICSTSSPVNGSGGIVTPRTGSAVTRYCPLWAWLHSHQPARFCSLELTKQLPRVVTHPGIAPASHSLNFGVPSTPKPVSSQKASC